MSYILIKILKNEKIRMSTGIAFSKEEKMYNFTLMENKIKIIWLMQKKAINRKKQMKTQKTNNVTHVNQVYL